MEPSSTTFREQATSAAGLAMGVASARNGCSSPRRPMEVEEPSDATLVLARPNSTEAVVTPVQETDPVQGQLVTAHEKPHIPRLGKNETVLFTEETGTCDSITIPGKTPTGIRAENPSGSPNRSSGGQSCPGCPHMVQLIPAIDPLTSTPMSLSSSTERPPPTVLDFMDDADAFYRLKAKLDPSHSIIKNWRHVGSRWGLSYDELNLLEERGRGGRSPTEEVLLRNGHRPLAELVQRCRDLNRVDAAVLLQDWVAQTWGRLPRQQELDHARR